MLGTKEPEESRRAQILEAAYEVATRRGLGALTVRQVAAAADLRPGLVLFDFRTKEQLITALLDWLLGTTTVLHMTADIAALASPLERLVALLEREMDRLSSEPHRSRLFFEYWIRGIHSFSGVRRGSWVVASRNRQLGNLLRRLPDVPAKSAFHSASASTVVSNSAAPVWSTAQYRQRLGGMEAGCV